jgi:hypothetical protein
MTPPIALARVALGSEPVDGTAEPGTGFSESALLVSDHLKLRRSEQGARNRRPAMPSGWLTFTSYAYSAGEAPCAITF